MASPESIFKDSSRKRIKLSAIFPLMTLLHIEKLWKFHDDREKFSLVQYIACLEFVTGIAISSKTIIEK